MSKKIDKIINKRSCSITLLIPFFLFLSYSPLSHSAQFIDYLPTNLEGHWTICSFSPEQFINPFSKNQFSNNQLPKNQLSKNQLPKNKIYKQKQPLCRLSQDTNINFERNKNEIGKEQTKNQSRFNMSKPIVNYANYQDLFGDNFFTYSKDFIINGELQKNTLALYIDSIDESDEVRLNGKMIGKTGDFPPFFQGAFRQTRLYVIPAYSIKFNQFNHLEIKTFSSINKPGLEGKKIAITDYFKVEKSQQQTNYIYFGCIAILLILALNQVFHFILVKGSNDVLYLAVFLVTFALIAYARSQNPSEIGFDLSSTFKVEMFLLCTGLISISFFLFRFFDLEIRKFYVFAFIVIGLLGITNLLWPFNLSIRIFSEFSYWVVIILTFLTGGSAIVISIAKKKKLSKTVGFLNVISFSTLVFDSLMQSQFTFYSRLPNYPILLPLAAVLVGTGMSLLVSKKYWQRIRGATYDHLTGTLLRTAFYQRLSEELQRAQKHQSLLLVAIIKISQFKLLNSDYGYVIGNRMLLSVSETINHHLKPYDLICHLSEDEFCIAVTTETRNDANEFIKAMHKEVSSIEHQVDKVSKIFIDINIGSIIYNPDHHLSVSQLLQDASFGLARMKTNDTSGYILLNNPTIKS